MKSVTNFLKGLTRGGGGSIRTQRVYNAYANKEYDQMLEVLAPMTSQQFISEVNKDGVSLVHQVAMEDNYDAMATLSKLPYFAEVVNDASNEDGWTPLLMACSRSNESDLQTIKLMVSHGAHVLTPKRNDGLTAVHFAASNNDIHLLDYIFSNSANPKLIANLKSKDGWTPAHLAGFLNNFDSLNLLIENGANLQLRNQNGLCTFDEIIRRDNADLLGCIWSYAKYIKRDLN